MERESCEHLRWTHLEHCTNLPRQVTIPAHTEQGKMDGARVGMNVTPHQKKEKNEEMKTGKRRAGEERKIKQATDFEGAVCCPFAVVQRKA